MVASSTDASSNFMRPARFFSPPSILSLLLKNCVDILADLFLPLLSSRLETGGYQLGRLEVEFVAIIIELCQSAIIAFH